MIAALLPCSFIDYPGALTAVVFTQGCNLRCRYCHNPALCTVGVPPQMTIDTVADFLKGRRNKLTAVTVSGGEPTLHAALPDLLETVRTLGFAAKLDTNGLRPSLRPSMIRELCRDGLISYLAVDMKVAPGRDGTWLTGSPNQGELALETLEHAVTHGVTCEARTTVIDGHHTASHLNDIAKSLSSIGVNTWRLQPVENGRRLDTGVSFAPPREGILSEAIRGAAALGLDAGLRRGSLSTSPLPRAGSR